MWLKLMVLGALLLGASELTASIGYDEQAAEVRALRDSGGVETTGALVDTFERERTRGGRRNRSTYTVVCGVYAYRVAGEDYTHREYDQCDEDAVPDTLALLYDASRPGDVHNNTDEWLASQDRQSASVWWFRIGGGVLVGLGLVVLGFRIRRRFASPRLTT
ncbi:hypothetical protein [Nocardioides lianchengensis]|uniref:DUF3592 domain-containing protein n=1 Tax=Nocardioides lianchengensis TaxID=1045774 RepID=A0A1G6SVA2_9ACTN|nr:hypothetical protein [Nocardioides lianchengensis]NYG09985.1 hypothetical protein [Nocardioides lianchengensis]SDD20719.1 hypothetical protein SAMN05421872_106295 [Nocardioides lianchengensis]